MRPDENTRAKKAGQIQRAWVSKVESRLAKSTSAKKSRKHGPSGCRVSSAQRAEKNAPGFDTSNFGTRSAAHTHTQLSTHKHITHKTHHTPITHDHTLSHHKTITHYRTVTHTHAHEHTHTHDYTLSTHAQQGITHTHTARWT
jgi:hypothetical protein